MRSSCPLVLRYKLNLVGTALLDAEGRVIGRRERWAVVRHRGTRSSDLTLSPVMSPPQRRSSPGRRTATPPCVCPHAQAVRWSPGRRISGSDG